MVKINGKEYEINMDMRLGIQKLVKRIYENPSSLDNIRYLEIVVKDILIPPPTNKEFFNFRNSDIEKIFSEFRTESEETSSDFKKKRSIL